MSRLRVAMVGISEGRICGVRDYTAAVAAALGHRGVVVSNYWLDRNADLALVPSLLQVGRWITETRKELCGNRPDIIILQYSVFAFGYRGIPVHVGTVLSALRRVGVPIVAVLHEFAYPWGHRGLRGLSWAATQRLVLVGLLGVSAAVVVTTDERHGWLLRRRWLPHRQVAVLPTTSNVPLATCQECGEGEIVGMFGYSAEDVHLERVIEAVSLVARRLPGIRLQLIGAPGPEGEEAAIWRRLAGAAGVTLEFTGVLEPQSLSRTLSAAAVVIVADESGPTSRRTTLAASLLHGKGIVAIDGPQTWSALRDSAAVCLVPPQTLEMAAAIEWLMRDRASRAAYESRAVALYQCRMSAEVLAGALKEFLVSVQRQSMPSRQRPKLRVYHFVRDHLGVVLRCRGYEPGFRGKERSCD